jgi:hypothetical protein
MARVGGMEKREVHKLWQAVDERLLNLEAAPTGSDSRPAASPMRLRPGRPTRPSVSHPPPADTVWRLYTVPPTATLPTLKAALSPPIQLPGYTLVYQQLMVTGDRDEPCVIAIAQPGCKRCQMDRGRDEGYRSPTDTLKKGQVQKAPFHNDTPTQQQCNSDLCYTAMDTSFLLPLLPLTPADPGGVYRRSNRELHTTLTLLSAMAAPAIHGGS